MKNKKLLYGIAINDADYVVKYQETLGRVDGKQKRKSVWSCPYYTVWSNMITRGYSENWKSRHPTYKDCTVCDEWLTFSNFKAWMEQQDWEGKQLDKDLLVRGNKLYSPETCVFVSRQVNMFITNKANGKNLTGVSWNSVTKKFQASCGNPFTGKSDHLGVFSTEIEAHLAWLAYKLDYAHELAELQDDERISKALIEMYENYY